ncbi:GtrA family protein [Sporolactobacillus shoreae]|uniref:GtrA family protein n=1 Tax=Sporolactobacillus shoreae TaxID=1465501 RepID=A0A4Z0GNW6_9BACL|nr:GtrA family protein [Sporolactobacillus shoreae]TGA97604.1 GtrA family protein [Sporolactobacillus shoreae]
MFQFTQFSLIGMINAVIDLGSLNILIILFPTKVHALLVFYNTIAYGLTMICSYLLNSRITFKTHSDQTLRQKLLFLIVVLIGFVVSNLIFISGLYITDDVLSNRIVAQNVSKLLSMAISSLTTFFLLKHFVFKRKQQQSRI